MTLKLHCFGESGNSYKAALALQFAGLEWEAIYVDFFNGGSRTDAYKTINAMGEVPALTDTEHDYTITQSGAIQDYISHLSGKLAGNSPEERREVLRWVLFDNHKLSSIAGMTRFLMNFMPEDKRPQEVIAFNLGRLQGAYGTLNTQLEGRDWLVGDSITNADISCCGYLFYPEPFGFVRADWPNIDAWLTRISETEGWKHPYDLMPGSPADRA
jgi:glutathione S-transferase